MKNWKCRAGSNATQFFDRFLKTLRNEGILEQLEEEGVDLENCIDPDIIADVLSKHFQLYWVPQVFDWIGGHVDVNNASFEGQRWLKCKRYLRR